MLTRLIAGSLLLAGAPLALSSGSAQSRADLEAVPDGEIVRVTGCIVREDEYARAMGEAPVPADASLPLQLVLRRDTGPSYSLTGTLESELGAHLGRRVELTGAIERLQETGPVRGTQAAPGAAGTATPGKPPTGAEGVTRDGSPAHEPGDAVPGSDPTPEAGRGPATTGVRPRLNVTAFRVLEGECPPLSERTQSGRSPGAQPSEPANVTATREVPTARRNPSPAVPRTVTASGCLVRQTPAGGALTAQPSDADVLALTRARIAPVLDNSVVSAVPGSSPSGTGSGTVPSAPPASRGTATEPLSFAIVMPGSIDRAALYAYVGQRIEVTGTIADANGAGPSEPGVSESAAGAPGRSIGTSGAAHPSAPAQRLTMESWRAVGGRCS